MSLLDLARRSIRAFHSSPHAFDKFEWSPRTRGTGEGNAAVGEGLYFAESPAVSGRGGSYWGQFTRRLPPEENMAARALLDFNFNREAAANSFRTVTSPTGDKALKLLESGRHVGPYTYEVGIRARPEDLLNWDKPIAGQPAYQKVRELWDRKLGDPDIIAERGGLTAGSTGEDLYRSLGGFGPHAARASEFLGEAGVPGHRFLDAASRNREPAIKKLRAQIETARDPATESVLLGQLKRAEALPTTHNYVIWQPEILDIMKRYGAAGAAPLAGLGAASQAPQGPAPPLDALQRTY